MKSENRYVLIICIMLLCTQIKTKAQISNNVVKTNSVWIENIPDWAFGYSFGEDTIVNNTTYKILNEVNPAIGGGTVSTKTNFLLREQDRITYLKLPNQEEKILYNFNLTNGDSFNFSFESSKPDFRILYKIDSLKLNDNNYTKIYFFEDVEFYEMADPQYIWIEGIGSLASLIYPIDKKSSLKCFIEDNVRYYGNKAISNCYSVSVKEVKSDLSIKFQNPISNKLNIEFENNTNGEFEIYNNQGVCIFKNEFNNQIIINEINWPAGLYTITVKTVHNKKTTFKIMKL